MTKKICDRCGKEMNTNPITQCQVPLLRIEYVMPRGIEPIDLCEDCTRAFQKWVKQGDVDGNEN